MNPLLWFLLGLAVIPAVAGLWMAAVAVRIKLRSWYTRPVDLTGRTLAARRSLVVGVAPELLDATHVRAIRLPFNRVFIIRSNPSREYDFIGQDYVMIGGDFENARELIGGALDKLGYGLPVEATGYRSGRRGGFKEESEEWQSGKDDERSQRPVSTGKTD